MQTENSPQTAEHNESVTQAAPLPEPPQALLRSWRFALSVQQDENLYDALAHHEELPQPEPSAPLSPM